MLEDHSGPQFEYHQAAKLVQRENYDIGKELVLPWKVNYVYRPGTLVMAMVTFKVWNLDKRVSLEVGCHVVVHYLTSTLFAGIPGHNDQDTSPSRIP